ncbi:MAG: type II toxin-antitoxin system RelB/DinJ family antitoxin [Firmicutes bacterium]|nr:type II toxin-antitoxin system RelB/DinJ family antitoxin [Bacillota bacterium]
MAKSEVLHIRLSPDLKKEADSVLKQLGLSTGEAVNVFLRQVTIHKGLPFPVTLEPKSDILSARREVELMKAGKIPKNYTTIEAIFAEAMED